MQFMAVRFATDVFFGAVAPNTAFRSKDQLSGVLILIHSFSVGMEEPMMTDAVSFS